MPTLGSSNNNNEEEEKEDVQDVATLNPDPVFPYSPPAREEDKGELQNYVENQRNITPKQKSIYILMVASAALSFAVDEWEPYNSYQELSRQKRGRPGFNTIKPSKELVAMEIKRRNPQHKTNTKNKTMSQLMDELENTLTDQRDVEWIKHQERILRQASIAMVNNSREKESTAKESGRS
jgi:hypothetical protein